MPKQGGQLVVPCLCCRQLGCQSWPFCTHTGSRLASVPPRRGLYLALLKALAIAAVLVCRHTVTSGSAGGRSAGQLGIRRNAHGSRWRRCANWRNMFRRHFGTVCAHGFSASGPPDARDAFIVSGTCSSKAGSAVFRACVASILGSKVGRFAPQKQPFWPPFAPLRGHYPALRKEFKCPTAPPCRSRWYTGTARRAAAS